MKRGAPPYSSLATSLSGWLCQRVNLLLAGQQSYTPGFVIPQGVVASDRLILIQRGSLHYQVEGSRYHFRQGCQLYVPAWVQRGWTASGRCELQWVEFGPSAAPADLATPLHAAGPASAMDRAAFARLLELWRTPQAAPFRLLQLEAEFKALLTRFFARCEARPQMPAPTLSAGERAVVGVIGQLKTHFAQPDALARIFATNPLSANYARRLFREQTGTTVSGYLTRLRMHEARYRLRETSLPVKEVARRVGYGDPLWFSKVYRHFWGHSPLAERED